MPLLATPYGLQATADPSQCLLEAGLIIRAQLLIVWLSNIRIFLLFYGGFTIGELVFEKGQFLSQIFDFSPALGLYLFAFLLCPFSTAQQFSEISCMLVELLLFLFKELFLFANSVIKQGNQLLLLTDVSAQSYKLMLEIFLLGECADVDADDIILQGSVFFLQMKYSLLEISLQLCDLRFPFFQSCLQILKGALVMLVLGRIHLGGYFFRGLAVVCIQSVKLLIQVVDLLIGLFLDGLQQLLLLVYLIGVLLQCCLFFFQALLQLPVLLVEALHDSLVAAQLAERLLYTMVCFGSQPLDFQSCQSCLFCPLQSHLIDLHVAGHFLQAAFLKGGQNPFRVEVSLDDLQFCSQTAAVLLLSLQLQLSLEYDSPQLSLLSSGLIYGLALYLTAFGCLISLLSSPLQCFICLGQFAIQLCGFGLFLVEPELKIGQFQCVFLLCGPD